MPFFASLIYCILALIATSRRFISFGAWKGAVKTVPIVFLAVCAWAYTRPRFGPWMFLGVALGAVGDYSLAVGGRIWFLIGLCAFLAGHVAYSVAFAKDLRWTRTRGVVIVVTVLAMAALVTAVVVAMAHKGDYAMIAPVVVYVIVMAVMMALAVLHQSPTPLIAIGAIIFIVSDAHIGINGILPGSKPLAFSISSAFTYYLAQYLLVAGAAYETRYQSKH